MPVLCSGAADEWWQSVLLWEMRLQEWCLSPYSPEISAACSQLPAGTFCIWEVSCLSSCSTGCVARWPSGRASDLWSCAPLKTGWALGAPWVEEQQMINWPNNSPLRKCSPKWLIVLVEPNSGGARPKKIIQCLRRTCTFPTLSYLFRQCCRLCCD